VRKLLSIAIILALLVTFIVPVVVAAQDDECCQYTPQPCAPPPDRNTKTLAGAVVWTLLGTADIMGKAVCTTTSNMACNLGGWSDELGVVGTDVTVQGLHGVAGIVSYAFDAFLGMKDLGTQIANLIDNIADALAGAAGG
jgi:hypothetical protein